MKATKLTIGFREWSKLADFVETINQEDEMVAYQIDNTTALLVAIGECGCLAVYPCEATFADGDE